MKREFYNSLKKWKVSQHRKPLLVQGARQVGKTYIISEFSKNEYSNFIYLNFEQDPELIKLFDNNLSPKNIIRNLNLYLDKNISSENTILFFDEIQLAPRAITSLKYFYEESPSFHIIAAGSLLGVSIGKTSSFPVGKVEFLNLRPMSYYEFLNAIGNEQLSQMLSDLDEVRSIPEPLHNKLIENFKLYLYVGGMPEVVKTYIETNDIKLVREFQNNILNAYKRDFSKYTDKNQAMKTIELWDSIPSQLAKENKKFKYSEVRKKARASTFESTIEWLKSAGLINLAYNISKPELPISGYSDLNKFKIYLLDCGLLGAMLNLSSQSIINPDDIYKKYNGAFIENFVAQELMLSRYDKLYYWTSKGTAEVDFIIQNNNDVYPVEVKSGSSLRMKSLKSYVDKYHPNKYYRTSPRNFKLVGGFINIPLYAIRNIYLFS